VLSSVVAASISFSAFAAIPDGQTAPNGPGAGMTGGQGGHPCKAIEEACKSAGFMKGGEASGKGLMMNCMKPVMEGKQVAGVSVDSTTVQACQAKKASMMSQHHGQGGQGGQGMMQQPAQQ
jgi:hypothetical protein